MKFVKYIVHIFVKQKKSYDLGYKLSLDDFERQIYEWNKNNPIDRYYREKHGIRFNSPEHRVCNFIDMAFEYYEDCLFNIKKKEYKLGDYLIEQKQEVISNEKLIEFFESDEALKI
jgi:hypothetical protein